jgi:hypothetical protein
MDASAASGIHLALQGMRGFEAKILGDLEHH